MKLKIRKNIKMTTSFNDLLFNLETDSASCIASLYCYDETFLKEFRIHLLTSIKEKDRLFPLLDHLSSVIGEGESYKSCDLYKFLNNLFSQGLFLPKDKIKRIGDEYSISIRDTVTLVKSKIAVSIERDFLITFIRTLLQVRETDGYYFFKVTKEIEQTINGEIKKEVKKKEERIKAYDDFIMDIYDGMYDYHLHIHKGQKLCIVMNDYLCSLAVSNNIVISEKIEDLRNYIKLYLNHIIIPATYNGKKAWRFSNPILFQIEEEKEQYKKYLIKIRELIKNIKKGLVLNITSIANIRGEKYCEVRFNRLTEYIEKNIGKGISHEEIESIIKDEGAEISYYKDKSIIFQDDTVLSLITEYRKKLINQNK